MVGAVVNCLAEERRRDLFGCDHLRQDRRSIRLAAATELSVVAASGSVPCKPLMLGVGHDDFAVRELDLVAGTPVHHVRGCDHRRRAAVRADQLIADGDLPHGRPAGRRRERRIEREGLPNGPRSTVRPSDTVPPSTRPHMVGGSSIRRATASGLRPDSCNPRPICSRGRVAAALGTHEAEAAHRCERGNSPEHWPPLQGRK